MEDKELLERFKDYRLKPNDVMVCIKKYKGKIKLSPEMEQEVAIKAFAEGVLVLKVADNIDYVKEGDRILVSNLHNWGATTNYAFLDRDYNIAIIDCFSIKLILPDDYIPLDLTEEKPVSDLLIN